MTVTALYRYPIKSCAGPALDEAEVGPRGTVHDREVPRLALVRPTVSDGILRVEAPGVPGLTRTPIARLVGRRDDPVC